MYNGNTPKYKMYKSTAVCPACNTLINLSSGKLLYRSCDSYVCSPTCSKKRLRNINAIDPLLTNPYYWVNKNPLRKRSSSMNLLDDVTYPPEICIETFIDEDDNDILSINKLKPIQEEISNCEHYENEYDNKKWHYLEKITLLVLCGLVIFTITGL